MLVAEAQAVMGGLIALFWLFGTPVVAVLAGVLCLRSPTRLRRIVAVVLGLATGIAAWSVVTDWNLGWDDVRLIAPPILASVFSALAGVFAPKRAPQPRTGELVSKP